MSEPKLIRRLQRFERNFTQLPNTWLRDEALSYRARGVLALLMSHETGWRVTLKSLASASPSEGVDALRTVAVELEQRGYLKRVTLQGRGGKFEGQDWEISDPHDTGSAALFTALDNPTTVPTALDKTTRTALDNPTPIRTLFRTSIKSSRGNQTAPVDNSTAPHHLTAAGRPCTGALIDERHCEFGHILTEAAAS